MKTYWMTEYSQILKENPKTKARKNYIDQVVLIKNEVRDSVIEKWLNYVQSEYISNYLIWRLSMLQMDYSRSEMKTIMSIVDKRH